MITLLTAVVLGTVFAIFSTQNTNQIDLYVGKFTVHSVPVYLAILIPLLIGMTLAYFIYIARNLSQSLTIREQKEKLSKLSNELAETTKEAHKLQLDNVRLKKEHGEPIDGNSI